MSHLGLFRTTAREWIEADGNRQIISAVAARVAMLDMKMVELSADPDLVYSPYFSAFFEKLAYFARLQGVSADDIGAHRSDSFNTVSSTC